MSRTVRLRGAGVTLVADVWGEDSAPPIVLLHGGGQTRGAWGASGKLLSALGWRVIAVDARGHGESEWSADGAYHLELFANDVRALVADLDQPPVLVGASLGGLSSMVAAGEEPRAQVRGLVLIDVAHRPEAKGVQRILEFMGARPEGFASVEEAAAAVAEYLPHRSARDIQGLHRNLRRKGERWVWHWDPRMLEGFGSRERPTFQPERLLAAARGAAVPILLVRGGISDVISEEIAAEFCELVPGTERVDVAGAGHMVAGDRNQRFVEAIVPFLSNLNGDPRASC